MRSEQEMMNLILKIAKEDDHIRAVILNGSRTNPNAKPDIFQDFDVVYLVTSVTPFQNNTEWIKQFGELMILQMPEKVIDPPPIGDGRFCYLMQFMDGNRIDLTIYPISQLKDLDRDSLSLLLLDKDGMIEPFPPANESDYLPKPPSSQSFSDCCNEFWWVGAYVAKGLWREEILYSKYMLDHILRPELIKMLTWYVATITDFKKNMGKSGTNLKYYLNSDDWDLLLSTYSDAGYESTWQSHFNMVTLFRKIAVLVAKQYGFIYNHEEDQKVTAHLYHVKKLPKDANKMY